MSTLAIFCLTTSNLPWIMDLTFQVPMQYCSLQHWTLLLSPVTSTTGYCFCFGSTPSIFLELFFHWCPVAYRAPTDLGSFSFSILSFCLFILFMGFPRQEYWSGLPFPSPVGHILSDFSAMPTHLRWPHKAWLSFIELDKAVVLVWLDWLVFCDYGFSVSALWCPLATPTDRMGQTRDLFKKIRDTKGTFHAKMGSIKDRNGMDITEAEDIKKRWQEYTGKLYKKRSSWPR